MRGTGWRKAEDSALHRDGAGRPWSTGRTAGDGGNRGERDRGERDHGMRDRGGRGGTAGRGTAGRGTAGRAARGRALTTGPASAASSAVSRPTSGGGAPRRGRRRSRQPGVPGRWAPSRADEGLSAAGGAEAAGVSVASREDLIGGRARSGSAREAAGAVGQIGWGWVGGAAGGGGIGGGEAPPRPRPRLPWPAGLGGGAALVGGAEGAGGNSAGGPELAFAGFRVMSPPTLGQRIYSPRGCAPCRPQFAAGTTSPRARWGGDEELGVPGGEGTKSRDGGFAGAPPRGPPWVQPSSWSLEGDPPLN